MSKRAKMKPVKAMKPDSAWAVVTVEGQGDIPMNVEEHRLAIFNQRADAKAYLACEPPYSGRIARVLITEAPKVPKRKARHD